MSYPVRGLLEVYEDIVEIVLMLQVFLAEDPEIDYLFYGAPSGSKTSLLFCNGPRQVNLVLIAYASREGSGEPAHPRSLARTFAARSYKQ